MIYIVNGDVVESSAKYICHQVNCQGVMGSGVARQIRAKWPDVFEQYKAICDKYAGRREDLLGKIQCIPVDEDKTVINIFGQLRFGKDGRQYTRFEALRRGCEKIASCVRYGDTIGMPYKIGCGLGGGDWVKVMDMLMDVFYEHRLILYKI